MPNIITEKIDIEVNSSPQFVEVFITSISKELQRFGGDKAEILISIPSMYISFCLPLKCSPLQVELKLDELNKTDKTWIKPLAQKISSFIKSFDKKLNI